MKYSHDIIHCKKEDSNTFKRKPFVIIVSGFNYNDSEDKAPIDTLLLQAKDLSAQVYRDTAIDFELSRSRLKIYVNCIAGVIFKYYYWKHFLNYEGNIVQSTSFESASNQIDLEIIENGERLKFIHQFQKIMYVFIMYLIIKKHII